MNRATKVVTAPYRGAKALSQMVFRRNAWRGWAARTGRFDYAGKVGDGSRSSVVTAPLQWIARNFPEAPAAVYRVLPDGQEEQDAKHLMLRLIAQPNPYYGGSELWMATVSDLFVSGDGYWIKLRNGVGKPGELWWTPSTLMEPVGTETEFITHYNYSPDGKKIRIEPEDVVHFRFGLDPDNPRRGRSPLAAVLREVYTDDQASDFTASLLRNMGVPGLVVSPDTDSTPTPDDVKAVKDFVSSAFSGDKRGEPLVMSGRTRVAQFGFSPAQLDLKGLRRLPEERVTAALGVPAIVAGLGAGLERSTFANFAEARSAAYEECIIPIQRLLGEKLRYQLLPDFEANPFDFRVGFDTSQVRVLQDDENEKAKRIGTGLKDGYLTLNEARRDAGKEPVAGGDVFLRPLNVVESVGGGGPTVEPEPAPKSRWWRKGASRLQAQLIRQLARDAVVLERAMVADLEPAFEQLGEEAARVFARDFADAVVTSGRDHPALGQKHREAVQAGDLKAADEIVADRVVQTMDMDGFMEDTLRKSFEQHYTRTLDKTSATVNESFDLQVNIPDEVGNAIIKRGGTRRGLVDVEDATRKAIARSLAEGREAGDGALEVARRIRESVPAGRYVNAGSAYRAKMIARTETKFAQNVSSLAAYKEAPTVQDVTIFDGRLETSDEDCIARDGAVVSFDEAETMMEEEHPNGTLSFAPNVAETI